MRRIALVLASTFVAFCAAEICLRLLDRPKPLTSGWRAYNTPESEKNQFGYRGQKIEYSAEDFVIVLLGDSQVECRACAFGWMPEKRLQHHLGGRAKVFSIAAGGYGQDQQLLALAEYLQRFRADLVVLWQTPGNDVWNNVFPTHWPRNGTPKPTFWLEGDSLRGPTEGLGQPLRENQSLRLGILLRRFLPFQRDEAWESRLPESYEPMTEYDGTPDQEWTGKSEEDLRSEKSHLTLLLTPRSLRTQYGLDLTRALMSEIRSMAERSGGRLAVFGTNTLPHTARPLDDAPDEVYKIKGRFYRISVRQYKENVEYLNAGFDYHWVTVSVEPSRFGPDDAHLNEHAVDQVMKDLAPIVKPYLPK